MLDKEAAEEPLPDEPDSGNEADSELENDTPVTFVSEPIVANLGDSTCNSDFHLSKGSERSCSCRFPNCPSSSEDFKAT